MPAFTYTLNQQNITLYIRQKSRKNIILRPHSHNSLSLNIPPWLAKKDLINWLDNNHPILQRMLAATFKQPERPNTLPTQLWWQGQIHQLIHHTQPHLEHREHTFRLPEHWNQAQQITALKQHYVQAAQNTLLPLLAQHSARLQLTPAAMLLSNAKTFWGVCRARTGIRLNWRLMGAPDFVQEYVCVHELCHLRHANHSRAFWDCVDESTATQSQAQSWLKQHGKELFILG